RRESVLRFADREAREVLAQMLVRFLIKRTGRNAGDTDFANQPMRELKVIRHARRRDAAPVDHDEVTPPWLKNFETCLLKRREQLGAPRLITRSQMVEKLSRQAESCGGGGLQR